MFLARRPDDAALARWLVHEEAVPLPAAPDLAGLTVDHYRTVLGRGAGAERRACDALRAWEMFRLGWVRIVPMRPAIAVGTTVGVLVRHLGLWSLNPCRIVAVIDERGPDDARFGFVYRTLPGHAVEGEERFVVEWTGADDRVAYDVTAWSRPLHLLARLGKPVARVVQRRFARDSHAAMRRAVGG